MLPARDVMTSHVVSIRDNADIEQAIALLLRHHVSGLPVVDADGRLVGLISEFDLLKLVEDPTAEDLTIDRLMTRTLVTVDEETPLVEVVDKFLRVGVRRLPVLRDGVLVGLISRRDLIRHIRDIRARVRAHLATV